MTRRTIFSSTKLPFTTWFIEFDDAYLGGKRPGKVGRGAANKTPFVAAVQTTCEGQPEAIKLQIVDGFRSKTQNH